VRAWASLVVALLASLALGACAAHTSYMGISFAPGAVASDLQDLARRAQAGDKQAQLDLGIAYEEGRGVAVDLRRAERLYRMAAADSGGIRPIYSPPTQRGALGRVIFMEINNTARGINTAKDRLASIKVKVRTLGGP
jgi:hypothetical protein